MFCNGSAILILPFLFRGWLRFRSVSEVKLSVADSMKLLCGSRIVSAEISIGEDAKRSVHDDRLAHACVVSPKWTAHRLWRKSAATAPLSVRPNACTVPAALRTCYALSQFDV